MNPPPADEQRCYRHPDREAYITCQRCERLICPDCMRDAAVGFQCPSCVAEGARSVRQPRTVAGGRLSTNPGQVTLVMIGLNVLVYLAQVATENRGDEVFVRGAMHGDTVAFGDQYWRLLTAAFLHGGVLHLAFNMYALYLFGTFVERALGPVRYVVAYLTMAVVSSTFVYWLTAPSTATVGASGVVFGMFGAALLLLLKARQDVRGLLVLLAINGFISLQANISWQGHLGGFLAGLAIGAVVAYTPRERRQLAQVALVVGLWALVVVAVLVRTADLTQGITTV